MLYFVEEIMTGLVRAYLAEPKLQDVGIYAAGRVVNFKGATTALLATDFIDPLLSLSSDAIEDPRRHLRPGVVSVNALDGTLPSVLGSAITSNVFADSAAQMGELIENSLPGSVEDPQYGPRVQINHYRNGFAHVQQGTFHRDAYTPRIVLLNSGSGYLDFYDDLRFEGDWPDVINESEYGSDYERIPTVSGDITFLEGKFMYHRGCAGDGHHKTTIALMPSQTE